MSFLDRLKALPVLFPLVAAFHIVMLVITTYDFASKDVLNTALGGGTAMEWALYAIIWIIITIQQTRWAAIAYIVLTSANLLLYFLMPKGSVWHDVSNTLLPFDVLMCFFLLFYYKRFR